MAKISIKSERMTSFGGIFHVREVFSVIWVQLSTKCWAFGVPHTDISTARLSVLFQAYISAAVIVWKT